MSGKFRLRILNEGTEISMLREYEWIEEEKIVYKYNDIRPYTKKQQNSIT